MSLTDVPKFENQNSVGINLFGFNKNKILPLYLSGKKTHKVIPLLLPTDGFTSHYCLITNFHAFMARQFSSKAHHRHKFCERYLQGFQNTISLEKIILIYVGNTKLSLILCQRKTRKLNLQTDMKRFQFLLLITPTQRISAISMTPAAKFLRLATSWTKKLRNLAQ